MHLQQFTWMDLHQASSWWHALLDILGTPWLQNLILALTAVAGILTFRSSSHRERRRATVDVLLHTLDDAEFQKARNQVLALIRSGLDIPNLLSEAGLADRKILLHVLSRYEFIATGVREGAFDARIYKRMYYTNVITDWDKLETFVLELRINRNNNTPFQELERLVRKWKKHPLKAYRNPTPPKNAPPRPSAVKSPVYGSNSAAAQLPMSPQEAHSASVRTTTEPPVQPNKQ
jgi:hypothetical protein